MCAIRKYMIAVFAGCVSRSNVERLNAWRLLHMRCAKVRHTLRIVLPMRNFDRFCSPFRIFATSLFCRRKSSPWVQQLSTRCISIASQYVSAERVKSTKYLTMKCSCRCRKDGRGGGGRGAKIKKRGGGQIVHECQKYVSIMQRVNCELTPLRRLVFASITRCKIGGRIPTCSVYKAPPSRYGCTGLSSGKRALFLFHAISLGTDTLLFLRRAASKCWCSRALVYSCCVPDEPAVMD